MKEIKVLGTGCANCKATTKLIEEMAADKGVADTPLFLARLIYRWAFKPLVDKKVWQQTDILMTSKQLKK